MTTAKLHFDGKDTEIPSVVGSEDEIGLDQ